MSQSTHSPAPLRPLPVKWLTAATVLMVVACIGGYLLTPKWQAVRQEQTRLADPIQAFTDEKVQEKQLLYQQTQIRANPHMTPPTREMIDKALALDPTEVTALMLLASDAFMQADYAQAISVWQKVMDLNSPRVNRAQLIDSINMAKLLQNRQK